MTPPDPAAFQSLVDKYFHQMVGEQARNDSLVYAPPPQVQQGAGAVPLGTGVEALKDLAIQKMASQGGGDVVASEAANALWNGGAQQAAWNAGADAATAATGAQTAAPTLLGNAAGMGALPISAIIAGTALGGKAAYDMFNGKKPNILGRATLGIATGGLSELAYHLLGDKDRWKEEQDNRKRLIDKGYSGWSELDATLPKLTKGRSIAELVALEEANAAAGKHSNVAFAKSRDVKDLKGEDIWGYSAFGDKFGNDWFGKYTENQRRSIAQTLLDNGAITEGRGQIKINSNPDLEAKIAGLIANDGKGPFAQNTTQAATRSNTLSPGIGKDGRRVNYGRR